MKGFANCRAGPLRKPLLTSSLLQIRGLATSAFPGVGVGGLKCCLSPPQHLLSETQKNLLEQILSSLLGSLVSHTAISQAYLQTGLEQVQEKEGRVSCL